MYSDQAIISEANKAIKIKTKLLLNALSEISQMWEVIEKNDYQIDSNRIMIKSIWPAQKKRWRKTHRAHREKEFKQRNIKLYLPKV